MSIPRATSRQQLRDGMADAWGDTHVICPPELNISGLRSVLSQSSIPVSHGRIEAGRALATGPVAILTGGIV